LDGCPLHCVRSCLAKQDIEPTYHYTLTDHGIKKQSHMDYSPSDVSDIKGRVIADLDET
jgi:uncharacterized metal-binding protein